MSTRARTSASGAIEIKLGFVLPENVDHSLSYDEIYSELVRRASLARTSLVSAPPVSTASIRLRLRTSHAILRLELFLHFYFVPFNGIWLIAAYICDRHEVSGRFELMTLFLLTRMMV